MADARQIENRPIQVIGHVTFCAILVQDYLTVDDTRWSSDPLWKTNPSYDATLLLAHCALPPQNQRLQTLNGAFQSLYTTPERLF